MRNKQSLFILLLITTTAVISFVREVYIIEPQTSNTYYWSFNLLFIFGWCLSHAHAFKLKPPYVLALLCGAVPPIGIPIYFFSKFGFKSGSIKILKSLGVLITLIVVSVIFEIIGKRYAL